MNFSDHKIVTLYTTLSRVIFFIGLILFISCFSVSALHGNFILLTISISIMGTCSTLFVLGLFLGLMFSVPSNK